MIIVPMKEPPATMRAHLLLPFIAAFGAALLLGAACDSDASTPAPASATVAATTTPPAAAGAEKAGAEGLRWLSARVNTALGTGDVAFFDLRMRTVDVVCTAADVNPQGAGGPACKAVGERFKGFETANWRSEGAISPVEDTISQLKMLVTTADARASDRFGSGALRVHSLNAEPGNYVIIFTAMVEQPGRPNGQGPVRAAFASSWSYEEGRWLMTRLLSAYVLAEELLTPGSEYTNRLKAREEFRP
ncbi:hypothetical protein EDM76_09960 [bacterium]|nr:MAG: hypothetical protein EDM76_09960 [bacterium]